MVWLFLFQVLRNSYSTHVNQHSDVKIVKDGFLPCKKSLTGTQKTVVCTLNNGLLLFGELCSEKSEFSKYSESFDFQEKENRYLVISIFIILTLSKG